MSEMKVQLAQEGGVEWSLNSICRIVKTKIVIKQGV